MNKPTKGKMMRSRNEKTEFAAKEMPLILQEELNEAVTQNYLAAHGKLQIKPKAKEDRSFEDILALVA
jgi:hypothetical protein